MRLYKIIILLIFSISVISCNKSHIGNTSILKQRKNDLLIGVSGAVCYSGFRSGQHPDRGSGAKNPTYDQILEDLQILSHNSTFKLIRVYDSGENSEMVLKVIRENNIDIKVMLGIWLRAEISNHESCAWLTEPISDTVLTQNKILNIKEIYKGIKLANMYNDIVVAVNVGNEALVDWNDHKVDSDTIISYVKKVKRSIKQPVTVAENYKWWAENGTELAKTVDFISIHTYPIWESKDINEGMSYTIDNITEVREALPDVQMVISEAGWPSVAIEFGDRASEEKQLLYYNAILNWAQEMNITTFIFEAFDEEWKGDPKNIMGAEKHWGLFTTDRKPKKVMFKTYDYLNKR